MKHIKKLIPKTPAEIRKELREIVYEARRQKIAQKAATASKKAISFSWEAAKAFVSDLQFKKEKSTPNPQFNKKTTFTPQAQDKESKAVSYYERWYSIVSAPESEQRESGTISV